MDPLIETLLQTGAMGVIAYLLIQYQREQTVAHREELKALLVQITVGLQEQSRQQRTELSEIIQNNTDALSRIAEKFNTLENSIITLTQRAANGHNLAQLKEMLSQSPSQQKEEDNG